MSCQLHISATLVQRQLNFTRNIQHLHTKISIKNAVTLLIINYVNL
jgi:hypothetical protein